MPGARGYALKTRQPSTTLRQQGRPPTSARRFKNKVSSARYQIPAGKSYRLYKDKDFKDGQEGVDFLDLNGTGVIAKISDFKRAPHNFGDKVSSSQFVSI